jgi:hypothetical protein
VLIVRGVWIVSMATASILACADGDFRNCIRIEIISLVLAQQENVFVCLGAAVAHALGHRVRL